ncbi:MAG: 4Fe-4S dicluster domain-containing protein [Bacillota bacterium]
MDFSRRDFLKKAGMAGLGIAAIPLLEKVPGFASKVSAAPNASERNKLVSKWLMVIDLKKCEGCETIGKEPQCTAACREVHFIPDGQEWIKVVKVKGEGGSSRWIPFPCMQCENAPCVKVCPVGASYHNEQGVVLIDHRRCIGCRLCMGACPYHRRYFNWKEQEVPPGAVLSTYSPEYPVPAVKGTVIKCMFCAHNAEMGKLPACVTGCPMGAIYFGDEEKDLATNNIEVISLRKTLAESDAYRYKEELGTRPRVFYLPGYGQDFGRDPRE